jgi:hypothetical protein
MAMQLLTLGTSDTDNDNGIDPGNTIYGLSDDGVLHWYHYLGNGASNPAPGLVGWHPNSGNAILYGNADGPYQWTWFQLGVNGTLMAIDAAGRLTWWRYDGEGSGFDSGRVGWGAGSGTQIADDWGDYQHVVMLLDSGDEVILGAVGQDGTMSPHAYRHGVGWDNAITTPLPGNWNGFTRLIATTGCIYGVKQDGNLYRHPFGWSFNPLVWTQRANWGNQIGSGFGSLRQLVVGGVDVNDPNFPVRRPSFVGIDPAGGLRWYQYTGNGSGAPTDWVPNSGNYISASW